MTLEPDPQQAPIIAEIFHLHADRGLSLKAIAAHLNPAGGPPSPNHVDTSRNVRRHWAATTIRAMLRNPVDTGRIVWNRLDFASARQSGGGARLRAEEEWVVSEQAHAPLVSGELFAASQARFEKRSNHQQGTGRSGGRNYLFAGMVHCAPGHQPLSMQGKARKGHHYYACSYGATYGDVASCEFHARGRSGARDRHRPDHGAARRHRGRPRRPRRAVARRTRRGDRGRHDDPGPDPPT
ncbi:MAG: recombinase [Solirubrobacterales bacterium]|nr:recombinase [Solirubrobacterales bacterium]